MVEKKGNDQKYKKRNNEESRANNEVTRGAIIGLKPICGKGSTQVVMSLAISQVVMRCGETGSGDKRNK